MKKASDVIYYISVWKATGLWGFIQYIYTDTEFQTH